MGDKGRGQIPGGRGKQPGNETRFASTKIFRAIYLSVIAGAGIYLFGMMAAGSEETFTAAALLGGAGWAIILGLSLLNYGTRFLRWRWYLNQLGHRIPVKNDLAYYIAGFALTTTPGKAGEAIRSLYLKDHGVDYEDSIAVLFVERLTDMIAMVLLAMFVVSVAPDIQLYVMAAGALTMVALISLRSSSIANRMGKLGADGKPGKLSALLARGQFLFQSAARLLSLPRLCAGVGIGIFAWAAEGYGFYVVLQYLGADVPVGMALGIYAAAILAGAISFIPGGLGTTEATMGLLLIFSGVDTATAVAATIICRVATLWFAVILGLLFVVFLELTRERRRTPQVG